jgi:tetratricopeptide (TPR) repeat protein
MKPTFDEQLAAFPADAAQRGPAQALSLLLASLRDPLRAGDDWARSADALLRAGFAEPAAALLDTALQHYRGDAQLTYLRGNAQRVLGRLAAAEDDFRAALAADPAHRDAAMSFAFMLRDAGRVAAAGSVLRSAFEHDREPDPDRAFAAIEFLRECGAPADARAIATAAFERWPRRARIAAVAGELALAAGDFARAHYALRMAVTADPRPGAPWLRLAFCRRYADRDDADLPLLRSTWEDASLPAEARICAGFALAKALDDLDDCGAAATLLREANAQALARAPWPHERWRTLIERQLAAAPLPAAEPQRDFAPVFIVGMPRTGTTLLATRMSRLPGVRDRGELNWIGAMHYHLAAQDALRDRAALQAVADLVRTHMRRDDAPARWYLDKNPLNFRFLDFVAALFPNARVIRCRRSARDTALSIWSQHFAHPDLGFAYDLADIARVRADESRLVEHWRATLPLPILDVDYEALVADPTAQLQRVARFLDVDADAVKKPAAADAPITTASVWQARQPVYANAVGRWRRYAAYVPELEQLFSE